jgi:hypothetical protein
MSFNPYRNREKVAKQYLDESGKINPKLGKGSRMFDKKGTFNAFDKKHLAQQVMQLLNDTTVHKLKRSSSYRKDADLSPEMRKEVLLGAFNDPTGYGMRKIGSDLLAPIKDVLDYEGWARKILRIRDIGQGEIHRIAKDVKVVALIIGQDGQGVQSQAYGKYIFPPEFKATAFPTVDVQDIYQMNFDVLERQQDLAKQMIMLKEDTALVSLLSRASTMMNDPVYFSSFNIGTFEDIKYQVERHRLIVDKFVVNRQEVSSLIKNMHNAVDLVTERELILMGYIGTVLSSQIITTAGTGVQEVVPAGTVYAVTEGNFLGEMGIRLDLQSEPFNLFHQQETKRGWAFMELISMGLANPRAVAKGIKI